MFITKINFVIDSFLKGFADSMGKNFWETSAMNGTHVNEFTLDLVLSIYNRLSFLFPLSTISLTRFFF